jgi:hypothetical protein
VVRAHAAAVSGRATTGRWLSTDSWSAFPDGGDGQGAPQAAHSCAGEYGAGGRLSCTSWSGAVGALESTNLRHSRHQLVDDNSRMMALQRVAFVRRSRHSESQSARTHQRSMGNQLESSFDCRTRANPPATCSEVSGVERRYWYGKQPPPRAAMGGLTITWLWHRCTVCASLDRAR